MTTLRVKAHFFLPLILAILLLGTFASFAWGPTFAATSSIVHSDWVKNIVTFNTYGQFKVNETLYQTSNSTSSLSSVTFGFPSSFVGHVAALSTSGRSGSSSIAVTSSTGISNNTLAITLSFSPALQAGVNSSVGIGFYVMDSFKPVSNGNFSVPILFSPAVSLPLDKIVTSIVLPYLTTHIADPIPMQKAGFSHTVGTNATLETWDYSGTNVSNSIRSGFVTVFSNPQSSGALEFLYANRQLSIGATGQVIVQDTLKIKNLGFNTLYSLSYQPLTNSSTVTAVPNSQPPLSNLATITISGGDLGLNSTGQAIHPNSSVSLVYQYPLGQQYWSFSNGNYNVSIPTTAPISAVMDDFQITSVAASGIVISGGPLSLQVFNNTLIPTGQAQFTYRIGIASAFGSALPIAGLMFIAIFLGAIVFRPSSKNKEDSSSTFDALTKAVEDKVSSTNEILSELKAKGASLSRNELTVARSRIDDLRIKTNSKIASLRAQLAASTVAVQTGFNEVLASDREFDRVVRDILNNYDQVISRKMKEDTFQRLQQSNARRLQGITNALLDKVHDVREEYESES
ncbi:MAG: hypothetical protein OK457_08330 [Thaumarchaeota archaeon]|nr:hypothetical protein [Nitrososphaerota archaeon]